METEDHGDLIKEMEKALSDLSEHGITRKSYSSKASGVDPFCQVLLCSHLILSDLVVNLNISLSTSSQLWMEEADQLRFYTTISLDSILRGNCSRNEAPCTLFFKSFLMTH
jgi:hypothetical protein